MDRKIIITLLMIVFSVVIYFTFQNSQQENSATNAILASQELKMAYEKSSQHSLLAIRDITKLSCFPTSRFDCYGGSCTPVAPATYYFVDYGTESGTYFRCDAEGCDSYPVEVNLSGEFTQFIPSQGQAMLFKVVTGDILSNKGEFVDVATLGIGTIISSGRCEFIK